VLRPFTSTAWLIALMYLTACMSLPRVPLQATKADLEILAGEWIGEYESAALGRSGSVEFRLKGDTNEASGAVLMVPRGEVQPYQNERPEAAPVARDPFNTSFLTIKFVHASFGSITGMLERYWDPDRRCFASTVFRGFADRNVVEGTFVTTFDCGAGDATGSWRVTKKSARR
jgi:hypothetical protein